MATFGGATRSCCLTWPTLPLTLGFFCKFLCLFWFTGWWIGLSSLLSIPPSLRSLESAIRVFLCAGPSAEASNRHEKRRLAPPWLVTEYRAGETFPPRLKPD